MSDAHDHFNGADVGQQFQVGVFLFFGDLERINFQPLFLTQYRQDVAGRHAAEGIKARLRKLNAMPFGDRLPGAPVQRHGIGQGAVTIKNDALNHTPLDFYRGQLFFQLMGH